MAQRIVSEALSGAVRKEAALAHLTFVVPGVGAILFQPFVEMMEGSLLSIREESLPDPVLAALGIEGAFFDEHTVGVFARIGAGRHAARARVILFHGGVRVEALVTAGFIALETGVLDEERSAERPFFARPDVLAFVVGALGAEFAAFPVAGPGAFLEIVLVKAFGREGE